MKYLLSLLLVFSAPVFADQCEYTRTVEDGYVKIRADRKGTGDTDTIWISEDLLPLKDGYKDEHTYHGISYKKGVLKTYEKSEYGEHTWTTVRTDENLTEFSRFKTKHSFFVIIRSTIIDCKK